MDSVLDPVLSTATAFRCQEPAGNSIGIPYPTCQTRLNGGLVTMPMRFVSAKNCTSATAPSKSVAFALILMDVKSLKQSPARGQIIETAGGKLPESVWPLQKTMPLKSNTATTAAILVLIQFCIWHASLGLRSKRCNCADTSAPS